MNIFEAKCGIIRYSFERKNLLRSIIFCVVGVLFSGLYGSEKEMRGTLSSSEEETVKNKTIPKLTDEKKKTYFLALEKIGKNPEILYDFWKKLTNVFCLDFDQSETEENFLAIQDQNQNSMTVNDRPKIQSPIEHNSKMELVKDENRNKAINHDQICNKYKTIIIQNRVESVNQKEFDEDQNCPEIKNSLNSEELSIFYQESFRKQQKPAYFYRGGKAIEQAIDDGNLENLAMTIDKYVGELMRKKIESNDIEGKNNYFSYFEEKYRKISKSPGGKLWIELAVQKGNIDVVAILIIYKCLMGECGVEDLEEQDEHRLNFFQKTLINTAFQNDNQGMKTFLEDIFSQNQELGIVQKWLHDYEFYPIYFSEDATRRNIKFARKMVETFGKDDSIPYYN